MCIRDSIKEAVAFGAGRQDVCAFINIDLEAVGNWAERRGLPYAGYTDLAGKDEVYQLIADCVEQVNADLATDPKLSASQISRFLILHKELEMCIRDRIPWNSLPPSGRG